MNKKSHRILVVDDEFGIRESCRKVLSSEGFDVVTAEDGEEGLKVFSDDRDFSVALIDLKMPRMGGMDLIEKIREMDEDVVLLVITAFAAIETAVEATKKGAYGYIPKPFTPDELLIPVKHGLEKRELTLEAAKLKEEREKRLLEVAYERSKSKTIINCMTDGVMVVNREHRIVMKNPAASRLLENCGVHSIPAPLEDLTCEALQDVLMPLLESGADQMIISREISIDKTIYMVNASPVQDPDGDNIGVVAVIRDITSLKKLEAAKSTFVSMVAHEIRSPLAAIEGYLNAILSGNIGENPERDRGMMQRAIVRAQTLRTMISELMSLSAIDTGHFTLTRQPINISDVVDEAVGMYRWKARDKGIEIEYQDQSTENDFAALADKSAILSVFKNLIDNAVKYTPNGGRVFVSVNHDPPMYVTVKIRDTGIGMTPDERKNLFDEFFRAANEETARIPGTGLGLTLVKRLVDMHQGTITVKSKRGEGSEFVVNLPLSEKKVKNAVS